MLYADSGLLELLPLPHGKLLMLGAYFPLIAASTLCHSIANNLECCEVCVPSLT